MRARHLLIAVLPLLSLTVTAHADNNASVVATPLEYTLGDETFEGYLAHDQTIDKPRPGVLIVHQWTGLGEYEKMRARMLADMGFVALAVDMYGKGVRAKNTDEARKLSGKLYGNTDRARKIAKAAFDTLVKQPGVDKDRVVAIGYCFGGSMVLQMAYSGQIPLAGGVSFHGGIKPPGKDEKAHFPLLICHGAIDPVVPWEDVTACVKAWNEDGTDYELIVYANAVHSFTEPGKDGGPGSPVRYQKEADHRSWQAMQRFFREHANAPGEIVLPDYENVPKAAKPATPSK